MYHLVRFIFQFAMSRYFILNIIIRPLLFEHIKKLDLDWTFIKKDYEHITGFGYVFCVLGSVIWHFINTYLTQEINDQDLFGTLLNHRNMEIFLQGFLVFGILYIVWTRFLDRKYVEKLGVVSNIIASIYLPCLSIVFAFLPYLEYSASIFHNISFWILLTISLILLIVLNFGLKTSLSMPYQTFWIYNLSYSIVRFLDNYCAESNLRMLTLDLNLVQYTYLILTIISIFGLARIQKSDKKSPLESPTQN